MRFQLTNVTDRPRMVGNQAQRNLTIRGIGLVRPSGQRSFSRPNSDICQYLDERAISVLDDGTPVQRPEDFKGFHVERKEVRRRVKGIDGPRVSLVTEFEISECCEDPENCKDPSCPKNELQDGEQDGPEEEPPGETAENDTPPEGQVQGEPQTEDPHGEGSPDDDGLDAFLAESENGHESAKEAAGPGDPEVQEEGDQETAEAPEQVVAQPNVSPKGEATEEGSPGEETAEEAPAEGEAETPDEGGADEDSESDAKEEAEGFAEVEATADEVNDGEPSPQEPEAPAGEDVQEDSSAEEGPGPEEAFPEGFPHKSKLESAGYEGPADLKGVDDLTEIKGIGDAYAEDIEAELSQ